MATYALTVTETAITRHVIGLAEPITDSDDLESLYLSLDDSTIVKLAVTDRQFDLEPLP